MTKLCQQYLSDIKAFFPIMGKAEKDYLTKLANSVDDYCMEENVTTLEEIYNGFGQPSEVISTYLTKVDTSYLIKRIRFVKWVKRGIIVFLLISFIGVSIYGISTYKAYKLLEQEKFYFEEIKITDDPSSEVLNENVVQNVAERNESEMTVADKKIIFPQGEIKSISIGSWSRKEKVYNPANSEIVQYVDALESAEIVDNVPENVKKTMVKIDTHILYLNSHGEFRTINVTTFGNGYHEISAEKDDKEDFAKKISIKSDVGKKYRKVFLRSMKAEKIIKEWIRWESQGKKGFESIQSANLTVDGNANEIEFADEQLKILRTYLKADKKPAEAPCGFENYFECIQDDGSKFHFSISADGESISTDKGVYFVDYPDNVEIVELFKKIY